MVFPGWIIGCPAFFEKSNIKELLLSYKMKQIDFSSTGSNISLVVEQGASELSPFGYIFFSDLNLTPFCLVLIKISELISNCCGW